MRWASCCASPASLRAICRARARHEPAGRLSAPTDRIEHLETHISHVFLAGDLAYKIKKPLELGFLDFSTLEKRRHFCEEELRINRRLAPDLYVAVVPITGSEDAPRVEGDGPAIEYAVKMRRFAQDDLLERVLERGALSPALIDELAAQLARFHAEVARAPAGGRFGSAQSIVGAALQNFDQLAPLLTVQADGAPLEALRRWTVAQSERSPRPSTAGSAPASCASAMAICIWATSCWSTARCASSTPSSSIRSCAGST